MRAQLPALYASAGFCKKLSARKASDGSVYLFRTATPIAHAAIDLILKRRMQMQRSRKGFTLIELLVVIAIIAILAAILFPVFAEARAKARQTSCLSNLKNMDLAFQMYKQDYDENLPYWSWWYSSDQGGCPRSDNPTACKHFETLWMNAIYPYVKNSQVYGCPSDRAQLTPSNSNVYWWTTTGDVDALVNTYNFQPTLTKALMSYTANEGLLNGGTFGSTADAAVSKPAQVLLIADGINGLTAANGNLPDPNNPNDPNHQYILRRVAYANGCDGTWYGDGPVALPAWDGNNCTRHSAGSNIGYADGHAKWLKNSRITLDLLNGAQTN